MNKLKRTLAMVLTALLMTVVFSVNAAAEGETPNDGKNSQGTAGIDLTATNTVIPPRPDPDLTGVKSINIHFGEHELSTVTETYLSTEEKIATELQHAGFIVRAGNTQGWKVKVGISGFQIDNVDTMKGFTLTLKPEQVQGTPNNPNNKPLAAEITLRGSGNYNTIGAVETIFQSDDDGSFGKWGCNWAGELEIVGGTAVKAGNASAKMLWTLEPEVSEE